jgi:hypothetical protein
MSYHQDSDYQDWLNELGENIPESYDDDVAMEAIVLRYVRDLEALARDVAGWACRSVVAGGSQCDPAEHDHICVPCRAKRLTDSEQD